MTILLDSHPIPDKGPVDLKVNRRFEIKITAEEARRQVNLWLHHEVSHLMRAVKPTLVVGEQVVWRVPAWIGFPHVGQIGQVGEVDVDVVTGAMNNTAALQAEIIRCAEAVAERLPPYQPKGDVPSEFIPGQVPPAPKLVDDPDSGLLVVQHPKK